MKKAIILILALIPFTTNIIGCGSSSVTSGKTAVAINLSPATAGSAANSMKASSSIPSSMVTIRFEISAPDMTTIQKTVSVDGRTSISESFDVPNGDNRHFLVEAMDAAGNVLYRGDTYANLDGTPVILEIAMVSVIDLYPSNVVNNGIDITFDVNNSGTIDANSVWVVVQYSTGQGDSCQSLTVSVPAGKAVHLTAGLTYAATYMIRIDPNNAIAESDESNNDACSGTYCSSPPPLTICQ